MVVNSYIVLQIKGSLLSYTFFPWGCTDGDDSIFSPFWELCPIQLIALQYQSNGINTSIFKDCSSHNQGIWKLSYRFLSQQ